MNEEIWVCMRLVDADIDAIIRVVNEAPDDAGIGAVSAAFVAGVLTASVLALAVVVIGIARHVGTLHKLRRLGMQVALPLGAAPWVAAGLAAVAACVVGIWHANSFAIAIAVAAAALGVWCSYVFLLADDAALAAVRRQTAPSPQPWGPGVGRGAPPPSHGQAGRPHDWG